MNISWNDWDLGAKTIFIASCAAVISMVLPWVDIGIVSSNGIMQGGFLLLLLYVYPALKILKNGKMNKKIALGLSVVSVIGSVVWIFSKSVTIMGKSVNASGSGLYIFLLASIALTYGIWKTSIAED
tara:strand:+ start:150 stop:530 length:381 start_codon:yes stop_codon:yes gene_type:complete